MTPDFILFCSAIHLLIPIITVRSVPVVGFYSSDKIQGEFLFCSLKLVLCFQTVTPQSRFTHQLAAEFLGHHWKLSKQFGDLQVKRHLANWVKTSLNLTGKLTFYRCLCNILKDSLHKKTRARYSLVLCI